MGGVSGMRNEMGRVGGRSRHSSSVVGLVHYVHHPTPSSERSDRRPAAGESGVKKDGRGR